MKFKQFSLISKLKLQRCEIIQAMSIISKKFRPSAVEISEAQERKERKQIPRKIKKL